MSTLRETFSDIADAIRDKGVTGTMTPLQMPDRIAEIQTGDAPMFGLDISAYGLSPYSSTRFNGPLQRSKRYRMTLSGVTRLTDNWPLAGLAGVYYDVGDGVLAGYSRYLPAISAFEIQGLTATTGTGAFESMFCSNSALVSADFSSLKLASGSGTFNGAFKRCTNLVDVKFNDSLSVSSYDAFDTAFHGCTSLSTMPNLPMQFGSTGRHAFYSAFYNCNRLTDVAGVERLVSSWSRLGGEAMFYSTFSGCTGLSGHINLKCLSCYSTTGSTSQTYYSMFNGCTGLTSLALQIPSAHLNNMFYNCANLDEVEITQMSSLTNTCANAFYGCKLHRLTLRDVKTFSSPPATFASGVPAGVTDRELYLPSMESITGAASGTTTNWFYWATSGQFTKYYFPSVTNITNKFLFGAATYATRVKEIHFAAANQSAIEALVGYETKWGATNAIIYFDL